MDYCANIKTNIYISVTLDKKEINKYNPKDEYYKNICYQYTTENGTDITLYDRKKNYNDNNMSLCEVNCEYKGYNLRNNIVECECGIKTIKNFFENKNKLFNEFKNVKKIINLDLIKCHKTLFSIQGLKYNIGSYIIFSIMIISIIFSLFFCIKGYHYLTCRINYMINILPNILKNKNQIEENKQNKRNVLFQFQDETEENQNNNILTLNKNEVYHLNNINNIIETINKENDDEVNKAKKKKKKIKIYLNDYERNNLEYQKALKIDKRSFLNYYISLLKMKHIIIFTFFIKSDYNSRPIKIILFLLSFSFFYTMNALFFTDSTIHQIYIDQGIYDFIYQLPQIVYSTIISTVINAVISYLSLTEESISELRKNRTKEKETELKKLIKCIYIKYIIFFILNFLFLGFMWYYLATFCAVYKNTQMFLLKDTLLSFTSSLVYPFLYNLIPGLFRIPALRAKNKNRYCLYKFSQFLEMF